MSAGDSRKRRGEEALSARAGKPKKARVQKKRKRQAAYHSDSESMDDDDGGDDEDAFQAVDLLDSDDEALDALADMADDGASSAAEEEDDERDSLDSLSDGPAASSARAKTTSRSRAKVRAARDAPTDEEEEEEEEEEDDEDEDESGDEAVQDSGDGDGDGDHHGTGTARPRSKRNDPATFATSLSKILGTKLASSRRADPVLARSAEAHAASRRVVDAQLEEKARRQMRLERRAALEKVRVKDVLLATTAQRDASGETNQTETHAAAAAAATTETTSTILATERRLRKVAQRGVVQLFNAVRAAQTRAAQAQQQAKSEGLLGMDKRDARVTEMSRQGFLDLIATGGGGLKKGGLEEA